MTRRSHVALIGTPAGTISAPVTLTQDSSTTTGLLIKAGSGAPSTQPMFQVVSLDGTTPLMTIYPGVVQFVGTSTGVDTASLQETIKIDGTQNPPCLTIGGLQIWGGASAPTASTVGTAIVGDWYFRSDTPNTANQRVYICTVAGAPGTWTAVA